MPSGALGDVWASARDGDGGRLGEREVMLREMGTGGSTGGDQVRDRGVAGERTSERQCEVCLHKTLYPVAYCFFVLVFCRFSVLMLVLV